MAAIKTERQAQAAREQVVDELVQAIRKYLMLLVEGSKTPRGGRE